MKTLEGFRLRPLGREFIIVAENVAQVNFNKMVSLNQSAAYLWQSIEGKEFSVQDLADLLLEKYDIDAQTAYADSESIAAKWIEAGIVAE